MGHTHLSFVVEITSQPPNPSPCISSLSSLPYWQLPPLKVSTQLDMLVMVVFTQLDMLVLVVMVDMVLMDTPELSLPQPMLPHSLLPPLLLPQLQSTMPSQLHVFFKKHPLLRKSSNPSNNGDTKSNTKCLHFCVSGSAKCNNFVGNQKNQHNAF